MRLMRPFERTRICFTAIFCNNKHDEEAYQSQPHMLFYILHLLLNHRLAKHSIYWLQKRKKVEEGWKDRWMRRPMNEKTDKWEDWQTKRSTKIFSQGGSKRPTSSKECQDFKKIKKNERQVFFCLFSKQKQKKSHHFEKSHSVTGLFLVHPHRHLKRPWLVPPPEFRGFMDWDLSQLTHSFLATLWILPQWPTHHL